MVHSVTGLAHPTRLPLQKSTSEESSTSEVSFHISESRGANSSSQGSEDSGQPQENAASPKSVSSTPSPSSQNSREDNKEHGDKENKQEESIQTCTNAIASLCIASEEPLEKLAGSAEQVHQSHTPTVQQESAPNMLQHLNNIEIRHPLHSSNESGVSASSKTPSADHSTIYSAEMVEKSHGQQGHDEDPASTKKDKESTKDNTDNR